MVVIVLLVVLYFVFGGFGENAEGQEVKINADPHSRVMQDLP